MNVRDFRYFLEGCPNVAVVASNDCHDVDFVVLSARIMFIDKGGTLYTNTQVVFNGIEHEVKPVIVLSK